MITKVLGRILTGASMTLALASAAAKANDIDFTCTLSKSAQCSGTVTKSGSNYSSTGIDVFNDSGPYSASVPFVLAFNTASDTISINGTGVDAGQDLVGNMTAFSILTGKTTNSVSFTADWPILPPTVQAELGTPTGEDSGFVIYLTTARGAGSPQSVDVVITPSSAPEPSSLLLLALVAFGFGGLAGRKLFSQT